METWIGTDLTLNMNKVARTYTESLDRLLDAYEEIGDAIPGLLAYRSMLEKHPPLAHVLHDYYSDVLRFHEAALAVFTAPSTFPYLSEHEIFLITVSFQT